MSTNPGSVIGTNAAYGGRTSVKAFNDSLAMLLGAGILSGWECSPKAEMTIQLGGNGSARDVAVAENATGDRITINNRSEMPIEVAIGEAPESGNRIDLIVAYVNDPPTSSGSYVDNPDTCGLIVVSGTVSEIPTAPTDGDIRTAITLDGASGETAFYVVLASVTVAAGVTNITADDIENGQNVSLKAYEGVNEAYTIAVSQWSAASSDIDPFKYEVTVTATHTLMNKTMAELINDEAVSFAKYGFSIGSISGQNITFYSLKLPEQSVMLKINYKEVA